MSGTPCRVFISYAHDSEEHKESILNYSNWLNDPGGLDCWIDRYMEDVGMPEGWPHWMRKQLKASKYVLVACSQRFLARYEMEPTEEGKGLGAKFESTLMLNDIYQNGSLNIKFIPIVTDFKDLVCIPEILQTQTHYNISNQEERDALYRRLTEQPKIKKPIVSKTLFSPQLVTTENNKIELLELVFDSSVIDIPEIKTILAMKPGTKLLQAFFGMSVLKRFTIASEIGLLEKGESIETINAEKIDKLCATFLERAYTRKLLPQLWSKLFDESIDPNPFKK